MIDTDNVKGKYCSKQEMIFYLNAVEEVKRLREVIKKIKDCATINAQHDDALNEEWKYILELIE